MEAIESVSHTSAQDYAKYVEGQFKRAQAAVNAEINMWYGRLASNNDISLSDAKKLLQADELEEFHWKVNEYIEKGKTLKYTDQWEKALENASAKVHINRLEAMKLQMQQQCEALYGDLSDGMNNILKKIYENGYYHTAYEIQRGIGVGWSLNGLDNRKIQKALKTCWTNDGKTYSDRIWQNKTKLINELNTTLTQSIIRGEDPQKAINQLSKRMNVSKNNAGRLIMTETAAMSAMSQRECFEDLDVEEFEFVATLDSHTSKMCRSMDGKHFKMSDYQIGVNAPPLHCWCRSCVAPYFNDEFTGGDRRVARGEDGKTYNVPADMSYQEWKRYFVDSEKSGLQGVESDDITNEWTKNKGIKGSVVERQEYTINGVKYEVDGKHVVLHPTSQERSVADVLSKKYGKNVEFVPQVLYPQGIQTPDYLIDGRRYDLKSPTGSGKNLLYGMIAKKKKQSHNFIVDVTNCSLSMEELEKQAETLYQSPRCGFLEQIIFMKDDAVVKALCKKRKNRS